MASLEIRVNGRTHHLQVDPETPLLYVPRGDLGLRAAKYGCGLEQCGACQVLLDGEAIPSCKRPVGEFDGRALTTLEGLSTHGLHPVQRAFLEENAAQCGYCTAGLVIAAVALLERNPDPTDAEIREALAIHLCRCGAHPRILRAVRRAAHRPRTRDPRTRGSGSASASSLRA